MVVDLILAAALLAILGFCVYFLRRAKKKGRHCVGCPNGCCSSQNNCGGCNGCQ